METGDDGPARLAVAALPASMADDKAVLTTRLWFALDDSDWPQAKEIIEKFKGGEDHASFAYGRRPVPAGCYSIFIARLQGENPSANPSFAEVREQLNQKVQKSPESANFLSQLAVVDALLGNKAAVSEARRAVEMLPISKDAVEGPFIATNLAVVYTWTDEFYLAFETLVPLARMRGTPVCGNEGRAVARQTLHYRYGLPAPQCRWGLFEASLIRLSPRRPLSLRQGSRASITRLPDRILPLRPSCRLKRAWKRPG